MGVNHGFKKHIREDHNMWNLYYMIYIDHKDPTEMSGVETYVKNLLKRDDSRWIPSNALCFGQDVSDDDGAEAIEVRVRCHNRCVARRLSPRALRYCAAVRLPACS